MMNDHSDKPVGFSITSDPDTTSISQQAPSPRAHALRPELPLRLLLASDLAPHATEPRVAVIDKNSFAGWMQEMAPHLEIEVANRLSDTPERFDLDLRFSAFDDFRPNRLAAQIPALKPLLSVRALTEQVLNKTIDLDTFRTRLAEAGIDEAWTDQLADALAADPPPAPAPPPEPPPQTGGDEAGTLDRLLGLVDVGDGQSEPPKPEASSSLLGALVDAVSDSGPTRPKIESSVAGSVLEDLDRSIEDQVRVVLQHPDVRQLESAWRGLKFLVDRLNFRRNVRLEVLPVTKEQVNEVLYRQVLLPEHERPVDQPALSAVILDFAFGPGLTEIERLGDLAETGASLQAPVIASAAPSFFEKDDPRELSRLPVVRQHFAQPAYIAWNKLRQRAEARSLVLALPSFVLRAPHAGEDTPLWGGAALAVAVAMAESFVETGWPTHMQGRRLEHLALWKGSSGAFSVAALIPESQAGELAKAGFVALNGQLNRDLLRIGRTPTVAEPEPQKDLVARTTARIHVNLASQLFVARAAHYMLLLQGILKPHENPDDTQREIEAHLRAFLHTEGRRLAPDAVTVESVPEAGVPGYEVWGIRLRSPDFILEREISLVLALHLPTSS